MPRFSRIRRFAGRFRGLQFLRAPRGLSGLRTFRDVRPFRGLRAAPCALLALLALLAAKPASAQGTSGGFVTPFSAGFFSAGSLLMDVSKLNTRFERPDLLLLTPPQRTGFSTISNDGYAIGISGYAPYGRVLLGGEYQYADLGEEASSAGRTNRLETTYLMGTVGYAVATGWRWTFYPFLSIGRGSMTLTLKNRTGGATMEGSTDPAFDDVVLYPGFASTMKGSYVIVQPGLGFDYLVLRSSASRVGIALGVRLGSAITPNRTTWKYGGRTVFGGPDVGPSGPVLRLQVGVGGFRLAK